MRDSNRSGMVLAAMCLATFIAILDTSLVNLGLHSIQADLRSNMTTLQWVIDLYNLAYAVLILTGGTLGDLYGRRRIFILGVLTFAAGSLVCALAPSAAVLIAGRGIAGIGAAVELHSRSGNPEPHVSGRSPARWGHRPVGRHERPGHGNRSHGRGPPGGQLRLA